MHNLYKVLNSVLHNKHTVTTKAPKGYLLLLGYKAKCDVFQDLSAQHNVVSVRQPHLTPLFSLSQFPQATNEKKKTQF